MVRTLADARASMPPKQRGIVRKEYGVNVDVTNLLGSLHYTAGGGKLMPDLRFMVQENRVLVRSYKPGDWETALKRAYDDLQARTGVFGGLSFKLRKPTTDIGKDERTLGKTQPQKKGLFDRLTGLFTESED